MYKINNTDKIRYIKNCQYEINQAKNITVGIKPKKIKPISQLMNLLAPIFFINTL